MTFRPAPLLAAVWALALAGPGGAQEQVLVRRDTDVVAVREGPGAPERVLYSFAPTAQLVQGGEVEQGSSAKSRIMFSGGGRIVSHGSARLELERIDAAGDVVRVESLNLIEAFGGLRPLVLELPGSLRAELDQASCEVFLEQGRLRLRNTGGRAVKVHGQLDLDREGAGGGARDAIELLAGEEVRMPLFVDADDAPEGTLALWDTIVVRAEPGVEVDSSEGELVAYGSGRLSIGGVRACVSDDVVLLVRDHRRRPAWLEAFADRAAAQLEQLARQAAEKDAAPAQPAGVPPAPTGGPDATPVPTPVPAGDSGGSGGSGEPGSGEPGAGEPGAGEPGEAGDSGEPGAVPPPGDEGDDAPAPSPEEPTAAVQAGEAPPAVADGAAEGPSRAGRRGQAGGAAGDRDDQRRGVSARGRAPRATAGAAAPAVPATRHDPSKERS